MKKYLFSLLAFCFLSSALFAQDQTAPINSSNDPIIPHKESVVVDNFTGVPNLSLGFFQYLRNQFLNSLERKGRVNVVDVEAYGIGRPDIVFPAMSIARRQKPSTPYDVARRDNILNEFGDSRYYMTVYISRFDMKTKLNESTKKEEFTASMVYSIYLYDAVQQVDLPIKYINLSSTSNNNPDFATESLTNSLYSYLAGYINDVFKYQTSIIQLGEFNKRGKLQDLYLSCGGDIGVKSGDLFYVYLVTDMNGIESNKRIGKVKARDVTGPNSCRCVVSSGAEEIANAFKNGEELLVSSGDTSIF